MINNIIFDFDGVLVDSEIIVGKAFSKYLAGKNIFFTEREFSQTYAGNKTINVVSELSARFNIKDNDIFFKDIMAIANNIYSNELTATLGIKEFLNTIQHKKLICSNSSKERIIRGLEKVRLHKFFNYKEIFSFDMVEKPKPYPDVYQAAVEVSGIEPKYTIIIEDSVVGVRAGVAANMRVIGLTIGGHWVGRSSQPLRDAGSFAVASNCEELVEIINGI